MHLTYFHNDYNMLLRANDSVNFQMVRVLAVKI